MLFIITFILVTVLMICMGLKIFLNKIIPD